MKRPIKDGWHTIAGYEVYVEKSYIIRGVAPDHSGLGERPTYPYESCKTGGWDRCTPLATTFSARVKRGTVKMF